MSIGDVPYCGYCNKFHWGKCFYVDLDNYHWNNWTVPITNYKCKCGGEFSNPAIKWGNREADFRAKYFCPFCGEEMKGLS